VNDKEKEFTSFDSQGPTDFDVVGFHLDTIKDIQQLLRVCHDYDNKKSRRNPLGLDVTDEKLDEILHYLLKLRRYVEKNH
jgi:hypothetical protein